MQNAAFNPVYRKWEVCKAFVQLLFCKDFDKRSTFAMIRVKLSSFIESSWQYFVVSKRSPTAP